MIKYLGSKRRLVPLLAAVAEALGARTALDLFTGTTRVAQALRSTGATVTAVDTARYAEVLARTYVAWDPTPAEQLEVAEAIAELAALPGRPGYVTDVFCTQARYFHPDNGARIDAIRAAIAREHAGTWREPILLTSLLEAADRVDSTTGVQMAYLKQWAPRALRPLELRLPGPVAGPAGRAIRGDAIAMAGRVGPVDLAYLDPPYNQHRYFTNYHVWETLVAWDDPPHYGVACKRLDARDPSTASDFNRRRRMPGALQACIDAVDSAGRGRLLQRRGLALARRPRRHGRGQGAGDRPGRRLQALRRRPDRHPRPRRSQGRHGVAPPQHRVRGGGR